MTDLVQDKEPLVVESQGAAARLVLTGTSQSLSESGLGLKLTAALKTAQRDPDVRCIVLTGDMERFRFDARNANVEEVALAELAAAITLIRTVPLPTVAVVHGAVAGVGAALVLGCDIRVAGHEATLTLSSVETAGPPGIGMAWDLLRVLGRTRTFDLLYSGRSLTAAEAREFGLLTQVVPDNELAGFVDALVAGLERHSRGALAAAKRSVLRAEEVGFDESLEFDLLLATAVANPSA